MPILENLKESAERATAYGDPAKGKLQTSRGHENPTPSASRIMVPSPIIRGGP